MRQFKASNAEVIFYSYSIGFAYLLAGLLGMGKLHDSFVYFGEEPTARQVFLCHVIL